jgi:hypothetical protein
MPDILGGVGRALGSGLGLLRDQIGYEWNQIRGGVGALGRGDIGGAIRSGLNLSGQGPLYDAIGSLGQSRSERLGIDRLERPAREGSVVQQGRVGDSYRPTVSGIPEPRARVDREMGAVAEGARNTQGAGSTEEWLGPDGRQGGRAGRGGLLRGSARLGSTQMLGSEVSLREHMAAQQRRPNQEY